MAVPTPEKRLELFSTVTENDNCLRAVLDRLEETLEVEFHTAIDPQRSDAERMRALEGLRISYHNLRMIEQERLEAKEWVRSRAAQ